MDTDAGVTDKKPVSNLSAHLQRWREMAERAKPGPEIFCPDYSVSTFTPPGMGSGLPPDVCIVCRENFATHIAHPAQPMPGCNAFHAPRETWLALLDVAEVAGVIAERGCSVIHAYRPKGWTCRDKQDDASSNPDGYTAEYGERLRQGAYLCDGCRTWRAISRLTETMEGK